MTLKDLHESWVKTGYPSRTEIRKAIEGLLAAEQSPKGHTEAGLREDLERELDRLHGQHAIDAGSLRVILSRHPHSPKPPQEADGEKGLILAIERFATQYGGIPEREIKGLIAKFRGGK